MNTLLNLEKSDRKVKGDYPSYPAGFFYQDTIGKVGIVSLAIAEREDEEANTPSVLQFATEEALNAFRVENRKYISFEYPTKKGSWRIFEAYDQDGNHIPDLLDHMGISITPEGWKAKQKLQKRLKRLFRQTKYFFFPEKKISVVYESDPTKCWDGSGLISTRYLKFLGIKDAEEWNRFSSTLIVNGGYHKDHLIAVDDLCCDIMLFDKPVKELSFKQDFQFLQLDPVCTDGIVHMDIQSLSGFMMNGMLDLDDIMDITYDGVMALMKKLVEPIKPNEYADSENKLVQLGYHELSILTPAIVRMRWHSEKRGMLKLNKMRFPLGDAYKSYLAPYFKMIDGRPVVMENDRMVYQHGHLMVPSNMSKEVKDFHGGADNDDAMNLLHDGNGKYLIWRSPNTFKELDKYKVQF